MNSPTEQTHTNTVTLGTFWPLLMVSVSLGIVLLWNVYTGVRDYYNVVRLSDQLEAAASQAADTEEKVKALFMDLLAMAATDADAKAITEKYNVRFTPPAASAGAGAVPATVPASVPRPAAVAASNSPARAVGTATNAPVAVKAP